MITTIATYIDAISVIGTLMLGIVLFYFPWQTLVIDQTRQRLFEIRDHWFDESSSFTDPHDKKVAAVVREEINSTIRMVHHFTIPVFIWAWILMSLLDRKPVWKSKLKTEISWATTREIRQKADATIAAAVEQVMWASARRSLAFMLLSPLIVVVTLLAFATRGAPKYLQRTPKTS